MGDKYNLSNANLHGSAVGDRATVNNKRTVDKSVSVRELRSELAQSRRAIVEAAPEADRPEVSAELDKLEQELDRDEPRAQVVRTRWEKIKALLESIVEPVARITDLVSVFSG